MKLDTSLRRIVPLSPRVLDPSTDPPTPLPAEGADLPVTAWWLRRERDGSVRIDPIEPPRAAKKAKE